MDEVWDGVYHVSLVRRFGTDVLWRSSQCCWTARAAGLVPIMSIFNLGEPMITGCPTKACGAGPGCGLRPSVRGRDASAETGTVG